MSMEVKVGTSRSLGVRPARTTLSKRRGPFVVS